MGLTHSHKAAKKKIDALDAGERKSLLVICRGIRQAQKALNEKSAPLMQRCISDCQGLCCRNIHPCDIITEWDLIYILAMAPEVENAMATCLPNEGFFPADCIFLENGTGPCLFPDNLRPERCIISFCRLEPLVEKEIAQVMGGFSRLIRFFMFRPLRRISRRLMPSYFLRPPINE